MQVASHRFFSIYQQYMQYIEKCQYDIFNLPNPTIYLNTFAPSDPNHSRIIFNYADEYATLKAEARNQVKRARQIKGS